MRNVICIKWGERFGAEWVNKLYGMTRRNLRPPFRFACFTDNDTGIRADVECFPIPPLDIPRRGHEPWRKLALFAPGLGDLSGPALFLDLDVLITGSLEPFFEGESDFLIIKDWNTPWTRKLNRQLGLPGGNSSVFRFTVGAYTDVYDRFRAEADRILDGHFGTKRIIGDAWQEQAFLCAALGAERLAYWPAAWVKSFKHHCVPKGPLRYLIAPSPPKDARILVFHGTPKMDEAARGIWPGKGGLKPSPWIENIWRE